MDSRIATLSGTAVVVRGQDIDTDRIIPARFLKTVTFDGLEAGAFADDRAAAARDGRVHPFDMPGAAGASILVVNKNFGCGSSREHAPQALYRRGIRAIVGESFAEIFFSNSVMLGLPCVSLVAADVDALMAIVDADRSHSVTVDLAERRVSAGDASWPLTMPEPARQALTTGTWDAAGLLLQDYEQVEATEKALQY
jgi:3-isopropylmalate/(R)-2-methylmalate dehydratase small subunit